MTPDVSGLEEDGNADFPQTSCRTTDILMDAIWV